MGQDREAKGEEEKVGGGDRDSMKAGDKDRKSLRVQGDRKRVETGKTDIARSQRKIPGDRWRQGEQFWKTERAIDKRERNSNGERMGSYMLPRS